MSDPITTLFPQGRTLKLNGEDVTIKPFKFKDFATVSKNVTKIVKDGLNLEENKNINVATFLHVLGNCNEEVSTIMCLATGKPRPWVDGLEMDDAFSLTAAIVEVNISFFTQKVLPRLGEMTSLFGGAKKSDGTESSSDSSAEGTALQIS
jgi:hypothetical protein